MLGYRLCELVTRSLVLIARFGKANLALRVREHAWNNRLQFFIHQRGQTQLPRERQVLMVLKTPSQISELHRVNRSGDSPILIRMNLFLSGVHQHSVTVDVSLIFHRFVWLSTVVESYWVDPHILESLANFLPVMPPMNTFPVKVIIHSMLEAGPDRCARIRRRSVYYNGAGRGTSPVINPVPMTPRTLTVCAVNVIAKRSGIPDIDRTIELCDIVFCYKCRQGFARAGVRVKVVSEFPNVRILRLSRFVRHVKECERAGETPRDERHPFVGVTPRACAFVEFLTRPIKRARNNLVSNAFSRPFVTSRPRKVLSIKTRPRGSRCFDVVFVHKLDPLAMRKAIVLRVEVSAVIYDRLKLFVIDHRIHAVAIRQCEVKELELDRNDFLMTIGEDSDVSSIDSGGKISVRIDLDPDRLVS